MKNKYFLKGQSSLQRKIIAGGLTAAFVFGTVGSGFAGAMEEEPAPQPVQQINIGDVSLVKNEYFNDGSFEITKDIKKVLKMSDEDYNRLLNFLYNNFQVVINSFNVYNVFRDLYNGFEGKNVDNYSVALDNFVKKIDNSSKFALAFFILGKDADEAVGYDLSDIDGKVGFKTFFSKKKEDLKKRREEFEKCFPLEFVNEVRAVLDLGELKQEEIEQKDLDNDLNLNKKKKWGLPKILGFGIAAVIIVALVLFLIIYFVRGSGAQEIKDKPKLDGTETGNGGKTENEENRTEQTQNSDIVQPDSQKSNKTKWIAGGTTAGVLGIAGAGTVYGVNRSRSNSIKETKKDKETGGPLVYIGQAGNKGSKAESQNVTDNDKNIVEDDAAKASENLEEAEAIENLENTETNEEEKEEAEN